MWKKILTFALFSQNISGQSLHKWIPVTAPHHTLYQNLFKALQSQSYVHTPPQVMTPPALEPLWVKIPQSVPDHSFLQSPTDHSFLQAPDYVDFSKQKTQSFYKSTLVPTKEPVYEFRYKVHDPKKENYQEKSETRVGDSVRGYYSVREPNGYIRLVKYVSDENGFKTQVSHHHLEDNGTGYLFRMTRHVT